MNTAMSSARVIIAGVASGVGKTTISTGLMAAFAAQGLRVQAYKVGPDYIDPTYHRAATGRPSYNLDTWLSSQAMVRQRFDTGMRDADIAVIEGVMGLFDGRKGTLDVASTAEVARLLHAPVLLVIDVSHMGQSAAALVSGFRNLDPRVQVAGVLLNRVASADHEATLRYAIAKWTGVPILGAIRRDPLLTLPTRHLGLVPAPEAMVEVQALGSIIARMVDVDGIVSLARSAGPSREGILGKETDPRRDRGLPRLAFPFPHDKPLSAPATHPLAGSFDPLSLHPPKYLPLRGSAGPLPPATTEIAASDDLSLPSLVPPVRVGIALDNAFSFYYPETLEEFAKLGIEVIPFSPLNDHSPPDGIDLLYFGGGFPELFAGQLAENQTMLTGVRSAVQQGIPVYAECGGYMYLGKYCIDVAQKCHALVGVLPYAFQMGTERAQLGYREITTTRETLIGLANTHLRGHEFHWSQLIDPLSSEHAAYELDGQEKRQEGYADATILASYIHVPLAANPHVLTRLLQNCVLRRDARNAQRGANEQNM